MRGDDFTIGMLVAFQMFASRVSQPVLRLAGLWQQFQQAAIAVRRLADVMDVPPEPRSGAASARRDAARLTFAGLGFRHGEDDREDDRPPGPAPASASGTRDLSRDRRQDGAGHRG